MQRQIFFGPQILTENGWLQDHAVIVVKDVIEAIVPIEKHKQYLPAVQHEFSQHDFLIPGLIDLHIHGVSGKDVMDAHVDSLAVICNALATEGVTGFLATTMTADNAHIEAVMVAVNTLMPAKEGARILGVHLEGPFIAKDKIGSQLAKYTQLPNEALLQHWQEKAHGAIKLITLAPELPGMIAFIKHLHGKGILAAVGHTNATYDQTMTAIAAGCTQATHLFNAMRGLHQREPGAVSALLLAETVSAELIVDGIHLHPAVVALALRLKGKENILLVTDAMRAKCMGEGEYELGGQPVYVQSNRAILADGTLAGSTLRMPQAIKNMVHFSHCSLADAVYMASANPARVLGLSTRKGSIAVGKDADLVVLSSQLEVIMTCREGRSVYVAAS
jgi:N-acetylglucosamine-6-phosphate deacetylase